jgi:hypothetical protein
MNMALNTHEDLEDFLSFKRDGVFVSKRREMK